MCSSSPSAPPPPPKAPEAPRLPEGTDAASRSDDERRRRAASGTGRSTILTSSRGTQDSGATASKTLLGQ